MCHDLIGSISKRLMEVFQLKKKKKPNIKESESKFWNFSEQNTLGGVLHFREKSLVNLFVVRDMGGGSGSSPLPFEMESIHFTNKINLKWI